MVAGAAGGAFFNPNGLALSSDEKYLYITNRGNNADDPAGARIDYRYAFSPSPSLPIRAREIFAYIDAALTQPFPRWCQNPPSGKLTRWRR